MSNTLPLPPADRLARALYLGDHEGTAQLLRDHPGVLEGRLDLAVALYAVEQVRQCLTQDPAAATRPLGSRTPLLHLAFSQHHQAAPDKREAMLEVARLLVAHGASVNDSMPAEPGSEHRLSALYGALGHARNLVLAQWLLANGADPNDNESLYHSTELEDAAGVRLLLAHGAVPNGTNALPRALDFDNAEMVALLLEAGADPNEAVTGHPSGQPVDSLPALHQAARRWCSAQTAALLLDHGADAGLIWKGHSAHAMARIYGNRPVAEVLEGRGLAQPLSPTEAVLAARADCVAPSEPLAPAALSEEVRLLLCRLAAGPVPLAHLKALVAAGLDPTVGDEMGLPPLHVAGWEGFPDRLAFFLSLDGDLTRQNGYGGNALETVLHGADYCPQRATRDHVRCAALLLDAGAPFDPALAEASLDPAMRSFLRGWANG